jgi:hypothetical protein
MKNVAKQYSFIKKDMVSIRYSNWFKGARVGFPNGSDDLKSRDLKVSKIRVAPQRGSGEKLPSIWLKRFFLLERSWKLTKPNALLSLALGLKSSNGSLNKERFVMFPLCLPLKGFFPVMERQVKISRKEIATINFRLKIILFLLCFLLQGVKLKKVHDVMMFLFIKNRFTML